MQFRIKKKIYSVFPFPNNDCPNNFTFLYLPSLISFNYFQSKTSWCSDKTIFLYLDFYYAMKPGTPIFVSKRQCLGNSPNKFISSITEVSNIWTESFQKTKYTHTRKSISAFKRFQRYNVQTLKTNVFQMHLFLKYSLLTMWISK